MIGMVILVVVLVVICSACKTQGNRGTVVRPLNQTTIHTVQNSKCASLLKCMAIDLMNVT